MEPTQQAAGYSATQNKNEVVKKQPHKWLLREEKLWMFMLLLSLISPHELHLQFAGYVLVCA